MPLEQGIRFYIPLELTCCLLVAYCHEFINGKSYDGFVPPANREVSCLPSKFPAWLIITGESFENLSYLSSCLLSPRWKFWRIHSNLLQGIKSDLAYTKAQKYQGLPPETFYGLEAYGIHWAVAFLKKRAFSLVISKLKLLSFYDCTTWNSQKSYQLIHHQGIIRQVWEE